MNFPFLTHELNHERAQLFSNYFVDKNGYFTMEGCWLRNQRPENKNQSNYVDSSTVRRRYIHFFDQYKLIQKDGKSYFALAKPYLYITNTLPKEEIAELKTRILKSLKIKEFVQKNNVYINGNMEVVLQEYATHPKNTEPFPENYCSFDITIRLKGYHTDAITNRMWRLSTKMFRIPGKRENPTYVSDIKDIKQYLPAQIEMGCGPSIEAGIPPLYEMHELYRVQNHITKRFYFAKDDNLAENIILNPEKMYRTFAQVPMNCINSNLTEGYKTFGKLYKKGLFCGIVLNNNFDRLVKRMDIPETILRIYDLDRYLPSPHFDEHAKSLICIGCHADRRQIERKAREKGLKVIFIDPEGFQTEQEFISYPLEAPKTGDIVLKTTFEQAMKLFEKEYL